MEYVKFIKAVLGFQDYTSMTRVQLIQECKEVRWYFICFLIASMVYPFVWLFFAWIFL